MVHLTSGAFPPIPAVRLHAGHVLFLGALARSGPAQTLPGFALGTLPRRAGGAAPGAARDIIETAIIIDYHTGMQS